MGEADIFGQLTGLPVITRRDKLSRSIQSELPCSSVYMSAEGSVRLHIDQSCMSVEVLSHTDILNIKRVVI